MFCAVALAGGCADLPTLLCLGCTELCSCLVSRVARWHGTMPMAIVVCLVPTARCFSSAGTLLHLLLGLAAILMCLLWCAGADANDDGAWSARGHWGASRFDQRLVMLRHS